VSYNFFLSRRIYNGGSTKKGGAAPAVRIALLGIAFGLAIILLSVAVVSGFKNQIKVRLAGFGSDVQIANFDAAVSYETLPIWVTDSLEEAIKTEFPDVSTIQRYATKPAMIKTDNAFQGAVAKGLGPEFDASFFKDYLVEGVIPDFSDSTYTNQIVLSKTLARKMDLKLNDQLLLYFITDQIKARKLKIVGIYDTGFSQYDETYLLVDLYLIQRLNNWDNHQVSGLEIDLVSDANQAVVVDNMRACYTNISDEHGGHYFVQSIRDLHPQLFGWLDLLDINVVVILFLMLGVAGVTMISGLLIIILEHTQMIGLFKALGMSNRSVRRLFLNLSIFLISQGMIIGNLFAGAIYFVQNYWHLFTLDPNTYYVNYVPMEISFQSWLSINVCTLLVSVIIMILPTYMISKINPATSMKYE